MSGLSRFGFGPGESEQRQVRDDRDGGGRVQIDLAACVDCGCGGSRVEYRLSYQTTLCVACFAEREGLL